MTKFGFTTNFDWRTWQPNPNPVTGYNPYNPNTPQYNPNISVSTNPVTGQIQVSQNPNAIQQWIDAALSGLAIWRGAAYVPTTTPPTANQPQIIYQTNPNDTGGFNNTGGSIGIDSFIQNNKGVLLIGGVALALLFMKPPTRR